MKTPRNELFTEAFTRVTTYPQVTGFGINCCKPQDVEGFLRAVVPLRNALQREVKIVVYPNSGDDWVRGVGYVILIIFSSAYIYRGLLSHAYERDS